MSVLIYACIKTISRGQASFGMYLEYNRCIRDGIAKCSRLSCTVCPFNAALHNTEQLCVDQEGLGVQLSDGRGCTGQQSGMKKGVADLDDCDEEPLLVLLVHGSTDGTDGPTERVQVPPRPLGSVHLVVQLLGHDAFRVGVVQMSQVH